MQRGQAGVGELRVLRPRPQPQVEAAKLAAALRARVRGEVRFDDGARALYATDASNYRQVPIGVVVPRDEEDVAATAALCREFGAPLLARGGGTSLAGQCCNVAIVLDFSKYLNRVLELDPGSGYAWVQPGLILDDLRKAAEQFRLTFAPDPATHAYCTLGGMIGNNSCGVHSVMAGKTQENIEALDVLLYDGTRMTVGATSASDLVSIAAVDGRRADIYTRLARLIERHGDQVRARFPRIPRRVSGYNLDELLPERGFHVGRALVGSEGTCALVLRAKVRLVHSPPVRRLLVLGFADVAAAGDHVPEVLRHGVIGLEGIDDRLVDYMRRKQLHVDYLPLLPAGAGWLLCEFGGETMGEAESKAHACEAALRRPGAATGTRLFRDKEEEHRVWLIRESGLGATAFVPGDPPAWEGWEDAAVPPERVGDYLRDFRRLLERFGYGCALYGHFGQGCIHTRIDFDLESGEGIARYRSFVEQAAGLVVSYGGSLSGEHGDGQARGELLEKMFGAELVKAFREFKSIWDPEWKMNPGKVVEPYRLDDNLRLGADFRARTWSPATHFRFPDDHGSLVDASLRCVGVGKCRRMEGGTMCPSFMVLREEKHTTRGRAHLLFEMLQGDAIRDGWQSEEVREALDLCLACKGCKGECPVNVDVATYKAEFLAHYYEQRRRPLHAYAFGYLDRWARLASLAPGLANLAARTPGLVDLGRLALHMPRARQVPLFAAQTFMEWWRGRPPVNQGAPPVVLFADTFNNHFHPDVAQAAVAVLEGAGFHVLVPETPACCGRPLYDFGLLDDAKRYLRRVFDALRGYLRQGLPIVVLEPSCAAVFRDEARNLFPDEEDSRRLGEQTLLLSEFLARRGWQPPRLERRALLQGHCHHKALMRLADEEELLRRMGVEFEQPEQGCCGMAGAFGFEREKYPVSIACAERALLPAVRRASLDTLIIADGFSCQEQIAQGSQRRALHLAQVLQLALRGDAPALFPERAIHAARERGQRRAMARAGVALAGAAAIAGLGWWLLRRR